VSLDQRNPPDQRAGPPAEQVVDPRGQRFAAAVTTAVLAVVLVTDSVPLLAAQAAVFAVGAFAGPAASPYGLLYRRLLAGPLAARFGPAEPEPAAPPRFAQGVGLAFAVIGLVGYLAGSPALGITATAFALAAAFGNAAFGLCLGCELYLVLRRLTTTRSVTKGATE
jgi:MFS family permease